jgi:8-amino-3,8-dideoxy-alpha-D-manno-octulosonate transaminase
MSEKLAIDGGTPVRTKPWPRMHPGESVIGAEERKEVLDVLDAHSPFRFYGPDLQKKVDTLESEFGTFVGVEHALGVTSGTAALKVSLLAAGVGPGDEVIVPAVTFIASAGVVVAAHARPVFAEVGKDMGLDADDVERRITPRTKAIMPVHILGGATDMDPILKIAKKHGIAVIEDCAQSAGCQYKGRRIGSMGDVNAFSLQMQKVLTAGEGGMVTTNDPALYDRAVRAHDHGLNRFDAGEPEQTFCAEVYRMSELAGAFGLAQLRKLDGMLSTMRRYNKLVRQEISGLAGLELLDLADPDGATGQTVCFYTETAEIGAGFRAALEAEGIAASLLYGGKPVFTNPQVMNQQMASENGPFNSPLYPEPIVYSEGDCPQTQDLLGRATWLWLSPVMTDADADDMIAAVQKVHAALL